MRYDVAIVGGGLAGASAALWLSTSHSVIVLEKNSPASGASGVAAGLVNPLKGLRASSAWRVDEALAALEATLAEAHAPDLFNRCGIFRPAKSARQAKRFEEAASRSPEHGAWLSAEAAAEWYPYVRATLGGLFVRSGGVVPLSAFVEAMLSEARQNGAHILTEATVTGWKQSGEHVEIETEAESFVAKTLILCLGPGYATFPELAAQPLHQIKGQSIRLEKPARFPSNAPAVIARRYVVPDGDSLLVGATFEHHFDDIDPDPRQSTLLKKEAVKLVPSLEGSKILDTQAGVRVTVPNVRLPLLGPIDNSNRVWIFTGLGAKGLMTAPLLAKNLPRFLTRPETLPLEVRTAS